MRISERHRYHMAQSRIERAKANNAETLETLSTQKRINRISDDPISFTKATNTRHFIGDAGQHEKNIEYSKGFLEKTEGAISGIQDRLIRAKELAVNMRNDTFGPTSREAASREIRQLIDDVIGYGNTSYSGRFVFSGFRSRTPSLSQDGLFLGDDGVIFVEVEPSQYKKININARNFFEANPNERQQNHFNLVDSLRILYDGLTDNDKYQISTALDELDFQMEKVTSYLASIGALSNALDSAGNRLGLDKVAMQESLSKLEDTDIFQASSEFKRTETILQSTLLASNKLLQPSLLNFMQ